MVGIAALVGFGWLWVVLEPGMASPTSTIIWLLSELVFALALAVPAVCLFFVIRAMHIRRLQAREAVGPDGIGVAKARDLLWSLSHGLLPQTSPAGDIPTDATELVFVSAQTLVGRHSGPAASMRRLVSTARDRGTPVAPASGRGWGERVWADVAATDRRILIRLPDELLDIRYSDITEVHLGRGRVVLRVREGSPLLFVGDAAESLAVLAVWGSVGESALRRHPALAALRS